MTQELNTTQTFKDALAFTLQWEGGLSNHSSDKGGLTNYGITQRTYDNYRKVFSLDDFSVKDITMLEVQWIYYNNYWLASYCYRLPYPLNHVMFDSSVNHGSSKAIKILQRILGLKEDGVVGARPLLL